MLNLFNTISLLILKNKFRITISSLLMLTSISVFSQSAQLKKKLMSLVCPCIQLLRLLIINFYMQQKSWQSI